MSPGPSLIVVSQNTLIGGLAGDATQDSSDNVAVGYESLSADSRGTPTAECSYA